METSSEKYCFGTTERAVLAKEKLFRILLPSDKVTSDEDCLIVMMSEHRRELIQKYILSVAPDMKITFSSAEIKKDPCHLKVEKKGSGNQENSSIDASALEVKVSQTYKAKEKSEIYYIQTLKEFELQFDLNSIIGICRSITPERYEITLKLKKSIQPLSPALPANIIQSPPPEQEHFEIITTLQLQRGESINVGEVINENKKKNKEINLSPSLRIEEEHKQVKETVFLSIQ